MPNLEPKILNAEKKQIVRDFNRDEVIQIINDGIDNGIIEIPQGITQELLGYANVSFDEDHYIYISFSGINSSKITNRTLLIFTYANCFVLTPLSQTGESRVAGNLVCDSSGNSKLGKLKFKYNAGSPNGYINVNTNVEFEFDSVQDAGVAYLFAFYY